MLNKIYLEVKNLHQLACQEIQRELKLLINTIDADPPRSERLVRKSMLMKVDIDTECKEILLSLNIQLENFNELITKKIEISKVFFNAPLKYFEEYNIIKISLELYSYLESITLSLDKSDVIFFLKTDVIENNIDLIYTKFIEVIKNILVVFESAENTFKYKATHSDEQENRIYVRRLQAQLIKLGENVTEVKKLETKLIQFSLENKIKVKELIDDEIHVLVHSILKQNIVVARMELRLNDDAWPLSVPYREFIRNLL